MSPTALHADHTDNVWIRYRDNFPRHLVGVGRFLQTEAMHALSQDCGYHGLRLNFEAYITLIGHDGARLTEIAEIMGISKQACNQTANQIEQAGYLTRLPDPRDGRAKLLALTPRGHKLRSDGVRIVAGLQQQFAELVSGKAIDDAIATLAQLSASLNLAVLQKVEHQPGDRDAWLGGLLPRLSDYVMHRLMELTSARGHPGLKLSFGDVLTLIGPLGGRMQRMAIIQGVSKQAISATSSELESLGYIRRDPDPADARQVLLQFTDRGRQLIADSVVSVDQLDAEFSALAGRRALTRLQSTLSALYDALDLESDVFEPSRPVAIGALARQLTRQLGRRDAQALARLLLAPTDQNI